MGFAKMIPDRLIGLIVTAFFLFITTTGILDFTDPIERKALDIRSRITAPDERNPDIELVAISKGDVRELGPLPWPRHILARTIHNLSLAGARVIALDILLTEPDESAGLKAVRRLKETYETQGLAQEGPGLAFYKRLSETAVDLDDDARLYTAMEEAGNVVLPVYFDTSTAGADRKAPEFILRHSLKSIHGSDNDQTISSLIPVSKVQPLLPAFAEVAAGIGFKNFHHDDDGRIRNQIHVLRYLKDTVFPSFPIAIVRIFKDIEDKSITLIPGRGLQLQPNSSTTLRVPVIDSLMRTRISWNKGPGVAFHQTSFSKVLNNEFQTSLFRDKIVLVDPTAQGSESRLITPISSNLPGIEIVANSVANILNQRFYSRPDWGRFLEFGILFLFGFYVSFVLPRFKSLAGAFTTLGLFVCCGGFGTLLFFSHNIWVKITPPLVLLVLGYLLIFTRRLLAEETSQEKAETESLETHKALGLSFQQQGLLDLALEKFRELPLAEKGVKDLIYNLGLDFERQRQTSKALSAYRLIAAGGTNFKDVTERIRELGGAEPTLILGNDHQGDIEGDPKEREAVPTLLGRYKVIGELGRGAMGVVYKGQDPNIHRTVAIKTLRLSNFEDDVIEEIRERFFREAESAGLLTHPNIVTIFDCGEGHDLAYIAMEYLKGEDLNAYTGKGRLLPLRETLSIVSHVAKALDYAHSKGIVHRDIKPANIMRFMEAEEVHVKVTDFGIARITSSSKTKTGIILGTPSYMSPEQIAGKKVDGRSDIFSLGIVLFEMLTGQKPFWGEDMTSLMFNIAREDHASLREINPKIPPVLEKIINKALEKDPKKRYQRAGLMGEHLKKLVARIDEIASRKKGEYQTQK